MSNKRQQSENPMIEDKTIYYSRELFNAAVQILSENLNLEIETPEQFMVINDILTRTYLNAIDNRGLVIDLIPFFFLYLPPRINLAKKGSSITAQSEYKIDEYTYDYVTAYFVMSIENLHEQLDRLTKAFLRFKEEVVDRDDEIQWVTQYLEDKLIKEKPDWWKLLDSTRIHIEVTEPLLMKTLGPEIGTELLVCRPYTLQSRRNRWEIEKQAVFIKGAAPGNGPFYLDYARIKVTHKTIGSYGAVSIIAKDEYGDNFVCDISPDTKPEDVLCCWRVFVDLGLMGNSYSEPHTFVSINDFKRVNEVCGNPLTEFKLKTLTEDALMKTILINHSIL